MSVIDWLLEGDPAIRSQTMRDLTDLPPDTAEAERRRIPLHGWGSQLLDRQAPDGSWEGDDEPGIWLATTYALILLKDMGVDPADPRLRLALDRVRTGITWWRIDGRPYFDGETEPCINGAILSVGAYFGERPDRIVTLLLSEQLADGGWNCNAPPSTCSSFHTTICVLEGLLQYETTHGRSDEITRARNRAHEYLLARHLLKSLSTGRIIREKWLQFTFPPVWQYDVLRGLDYFRKVGGPPDPRLAEAAAVVTNRRDPDGRWPLDALHADRVPFDMESPGAPSRWNTLRALRVLKWFTP